MAGGVAAIAGGLGGMALAMMPIPVMDRLNGLVPGDTPVYTSEGFVVAMTDAARGAWAHNGIEALTRVAKVDWRAAGLDYLDQKHHGPLGPEQRRGYFRNYKEWALKGTAHPIIDPAWDWLIANWPEDGEFIELCWGDARPGNQMYGGPDLSEVIGVFDWEMVRRYTPRPRSGRQNVFNLIGHDVVVILLLSLSGAPARPRTRRY